MFREAVGYLWADRDERTTTVLLGGMLTFFTFLVVPQIILLGYVVRVLRRTSSGDETPPTFDRWIDLLVVGSKAYVIWLGWTIIPLLVRFGLSGGHLEPGQATFWLLGWMLAPNVISVLQKGAGTSGLLEGFGFTEPYVDLLIVLYFIPAALANYAEQGTLRSGFFEGGLRRYLAWSIDLLENLLPRLADIARRLLDRVLPESESEFGPVSTFTNCRYMIAWSVYFLLWLTAEAVLQAFVYLPSPRGWGTVLNMVYLLGALLAFFYLRVSAWSIIGRAWPDVRPITGDYSVETDHAPEKTSEAAHGTGARPRRYRVLAWIESDTPPLKTAIAGGLMLTFGIVMLPGIVVAGYLVRVLRATILGEAVPLFGEFRKLLFDGLGAYLIWVGYSLIPAGLLFIGVSSRLGSELTLTDITLLGSVIGVGLPGGWPAILLGIGVGAGLVLVLLLALVFLLPTALLPIPEAIIAIPIPIALLVFVSSTYVVPAALLAFAETGSLRAGFTLRSLVPTLRSGRYAVRWLVAMILLTPGWLAILGINLLLVHPLFGDTPLAEPIAGLEYLVFFSGPTSVRAVSFWLFLVLSGVVYFTVLVTACRIIGRVNQKVSPGTSVFGNL